MQKRYPHRDTHNDTPSVSELWTQWESRAVVLSKQECVDRGLHRKTDVYEWLYTLGIQPDAYIVRKASRYSTGYIEIRLQSEADMAFIKMSGL